MTYGSTCFDRPKLLTLDLFLMTYNSTCSDRSPMLTDDEVDDEDGQVGSQQPLQQLSSMRSEVTGRVGTSFYMSPEVAHVLACII